jgi:hypothetical protein
MLTPQKSYRFTHINGPVLGLLGEWRCVPSADLRTCSNIMEQNYPYSIVSSARNSEQYLAN